MLNSKKQYLKAMRTDEREYVALSAGAQHTSAIKSMCIGANIMDYRPTYIYTDNQLEISRIN